MTYDVAANDAYNNSPFIPDDGVIVTDGVYAQMSNVVACNIYYG
jgi:hypothetical protein